MKCDIALGTDLSPAVAAAIPELLDAAITVTGLRVSRGHQEVLHGMNFRVERAILDQPAGSAPLRHRIGYSTQDPAVYQDLTVVENLRYFATILRAPRSDVDRVLAGRRRPGHTVRSGRHG